MQNPGQYTLDKIRGSKESIRALSGSRRMQSDRVIVKLKRTKKSIGLLKKEFSPGENTSFLTSLVQRGYAKHIQPVFPTKSMAGGGGLRRLAADLEGKQTKRIADGLVSILLEPDTKATDLVDRLNSLPIEVDYAFIPPIKRLFLPSSSGGSSDPLHSRQWGHGAVKIHTARKIHGFKEPKDLTVAVVDSGIDENHPDLHGILSEYVNFISNEDKQDLVGHGTHVTGIITANRNNDVGIAGLCKTKILAIKGLPSSDDIYDPDEYYRALAYPIDKGADVINLSLGGGFDPAEKDIIQDALDAGISVVAAMGNEFLKGNPVEYPAGYPGVIAVGASDEMDRRASFSNTGKHITLVAPGEHILSTVPTYPSIFAETLNYDSWPGTSMATPFVAAAVALIKAKFPNLDPADIKKRLIKSVDRVPNQKTSFTEEYGWGRLNIEAALT